MIAICAESCALAAVYVTVIVHDVKGFKSAGQLLVWVNVEGSIISILLIAAGCMPWFWITIR